MGHAALAALQGNRNKNKPLPRRRATTKKETLAVTQGLVSAVCVPFRCCLVVRLESGVVLGHKRPLHFRLEIIKQILYDVWTRGSCVPLQVLRISHAPCRSIVLGAARSAVPKLRRRWVHMIISLFRKIVFSGFAEMTWRSPKNILTIRRWTARWLATQTGGLLALCRSKSAFAETQGNNRHARHR